MSCCPSVLIRAYSCSFRSFLSAADIFLRMIITFSCMLNVQEVFTDWFLSFKSKVPLMHCYYFEYLTCIHSVLMSAAWTSTFELFISSCFDFIRQTNSCIKLTIKNTRIYLTDTFHGSICFTNDVLWSKTSQRPCLF